MNWQVFEICNIFSLYSFPSIKTFTFAPYKFDKDWHWKLTRDKKIFLLSQNLLFVITKWCLLCVFIGSVSTLAEYHLSKLSPRKRNQKIIFHFHLSNFLTFQPWQFMCILHVFKILKSSCNLHNKLHLPSNLNWYKINKKNHIFQSHIYSAAWQ